jgi:hypothetical protein
MSFVRFVCHVLPALPRAGADGRMNDSPRRAARKDTPALASPDIDADRCDASAPVCTANVTCLHADDPRAATLEVTRDTKPLDARRGGIVECGAVEDDVCPRTLLRRRQRDARRIDRRRDHERAECCGDRNDQSPHDVSTPQRGRCVTTSPISCGEHGTCGRIRVRPRRVPRRSRRAPAPVQRARSRSRCLSLRRPRSSRSPEVRRAPSVLARRSCRNPRVRPRDEARSPTGA